MQERFRLIIIIIILIIIIVIVSKLDPPKSRLPLGVRDPIYHSVSLDPTIVGFRCQMASKSVEGFKQASRM